MQKTKSILLSIAWTILILIFPVVSGVIVVVSGMDQINEYLTQGCFMLTSIVIPVVYIKKRKINIKEIGLRKAESGSVRKVLLFIPVVLSEVPLILVGVDFKSLTYVSALTFFALVVGISEELYFRGIIFKLLKDHFSVKQTVVISALIFGIGHIASALSGKGIVEVLLQIINAIVFGILAAEIVTVTKSLIPTIIWHFVFNYINDITLATGMNEIFVLGLQEIIMITYAYILWNKVPSRNKDIVKLSDYKL